MSEVKEKPEEDLKVKEELDGSAVVDLPNDMKSPDEDDDPKDKVESSHEEHDDPNDSEEERREKISRRKARRIRQKHDNAEKDVKLQQLERQNQELMQRLSQVERKTHGAEIARVDKAIEDQELRLQYARLKITEATSAMDGEAMAKAQDLLYETRQQLDALKNLKKQASQQPAQKQNIPDPRLQRNASEWMERNSWYRPDASDEDSEIAKVVDKRLVEEGWDPNRPEYWEELDNRLQRRLPHRYNNDTDGEPVVRQRPRNVVTSSGRESSSASAGRNTYTLEPEQVRAMKDAGFWDDPVKRNKMIKRYAMEARLQRSN
jgi:hypothetical protein